MVHLACFTLNLWPKTRCVCIVILLMCLIFLNNESLLMTYDFWLRLPCIRAWLMFLIHDLRLRLQCMCLVVTVQLFCLFVWGDYSAIPFCLKQQNFWLSSHGSKWIMNIALEFQQSLVTTVDINWSINLRIHAPNNSSCDLPSHFSIYSFIDFTNYYSYRNPPFLFLF